MSMRSLILLACLSCVGVLAEEQDIATVLAPSLGETASADDLTSLTLNVLPDGQGLPAGSGTVSEGRALYAAHCVSCHGVDGQNGINDALAGGHDTLTSNRPVRTVGSYWPYATTIFDYINRAMPYRDPGSLSHDDVYALTAYLLHVNDILDERATLDAASLKRIEMPNRNNFIWAINPGATQ